MDHQGDKVYGQKNPDCSQSQFHVGTYGSGPTYVGEGTTVHIHEDKRTTAVLNVNFKFEVQPYADDRKELPAVGTVRKLAEVLEGKEPNATSNDDVDGFEEKYEDVFQLVDKRDEYLQPIMESVKRRLETLDLVHDAELKKKGTLDLAHEAKAEKKVETLELGREAEVKKKAIDFVHGVEVKKKETLDFDHEAEIEKEETIYTDLDHRKAEVKRKGTPGFDNETEVKKKEILDLGHEELKKKETLGFDYDTEAKTTLGFDYETEAKEKGAERNEANFVEENERFPAPNSHITRGIERLRKKERLDEIVDEYCNSERASEMKKIMEIVHTKLNSLSANFNNNCNIHQAESNLRAFLLRSSDTLIKGINLYASLLTLMVQNSFPLDNVRTLKSLLTNLERIVQPSNFSRMSRVRRDIETVISLLSAFTKKLKDKKLANVAKLLTKIKDAPEKESLARKYLESKCWMQHYLVVSSLKMQVLGQLDEDILTAFTQVIDWLSASLNKMDSSYRWKFIVTVVESLVQIAREAPDPARKKAIDSLCNLYYVLQEKKLNDCMGLFQQRARVLVFSQDMNIRSLLLEGIFKELDTDTEEMCKERLEFCKDLSLTATGNRLHSGNHVWIFYAYSDGMEVIVKCYKETRDELLKKRLGSQSSYCEYECKFLNELRHPNIIQLIAFDERVKCVLLEPVSNGNLLDVLRKRRSDALVPTLTELLWIAVNITHALKYLEAEEILHLAVQAGNVLLHDRNNSIIAKLTGFQFCRTRKQIGKSGVKKSVEKRHFKWMDPQALRFESLDPKTVSWSFGIFLYELLTLGCVPYNNHGSCSEHGDFKREPFTSLKARIFVIRGGKLGKEPCIPKDIFSIITENCLQSNYSSRASPQQLQEILSDQIKNLEISDKISAPPELILEKEDLNPGNYNPGIDDDDDFPFAHLDVSEHIWNQEYDCDHDFEDGYNNADPSKCEPVLCVIKRQQEGNEHKEICVLEYVPFKDIKLVEKLKTLDCPQLIKVIAVNPYGPHTLEMISESLPQGNVLDAMLQRPKLREFYKSYVYQAAMAVAYLHKHGIVHRNLKVENYLLANYQNIKLGRLGMSMDELDPNTLYYEPVDKDPRWNAPEVLKFGYYSQTSDVWSFGVVVWEFIKIVSCSPNTKRQDVLPYSHIPDNEVFHVVVDQRDVLQNPDPSCESLYHIYRRCCAPDARSRPKASHVVSLTQSLKDLHLLRRALPKTPAETSNEYIGANALSNTYAPLGRRDSTENLYQNYLHNVNSSAVDEFSEENIGVHGGREDTGSESEDLYAGDIQETYDYSRGITTNTSECTTRSYNGDCTKGKVDNDNAEWSDNHYDEVYGDESRHEYSEVCECDDQMKSDNDEVYERSNSSSRSVLLRFYSQEWPEEDADEVAFEGKNSHKNKMSDATCEDLIEQDTSYSSNIQPNELQESEREVDSDIAQNIGSEGHVKNMLNRFSKKP